jgi:hypothetical protein
MTGVPASPSGSRRSGRASKAVSPPIGASIPNAVTCSSCGHTALLIADRASLSFMTDGHFFLRVPALMPEEIIDWLCERLRTDEGENQNYTRYGMLCAVRISSGGREIRQVGQHVHPRGGSDEHIAKFRKDAQAWVAAIYADPDAVRLITASAIEARRAASEAAVHESAIGDSRDAQTPSPNLSQGDTP